MKRRISAILAADIVGYSKLVAEDEEETVRRLAVYRKVFDESAARHGGRVVNMVGDAILAEFPSSVDAVRCAIHAQESIRTVNLAYASIRRMNVRIGIAVGDVIDRDGQIYGDGVNIAARLEGLSRPGGLCVSQTVYEHVVNELSVQFDDMGEQLLKNIPNPVHAYMMAPDPRSGDDAGSGSSPAAASRRRSRLTLGAALALAMAAGSLATAWQLHRPSQGSLGSRPVSLDRPPADPASQDVTRGFDQAKVRALAANQGMVLPPAFRVLSPGSSVPADVAAYLGAWGGDKRWNEGGRQAILIVETVDAAGVALGVYAQGPPPNKNAVNRNPGRVSFVGSITDRGLGFAWGASKYTFKLMPDGSLAGTWQPGNPGQLDLTITLARIE